MTDFGNSTPIAPDNATTIRSKRGELLARMSFEKDKIIFREGQGGTDAYVVESGRVGVFKDADGKMVRLAVMEKGAMFGEMAAITGEPRAATMVALEPTVVVRISKTMIHQKIEACDPFVKALLNILISNLSRVNERYVAKNVVLDKLVAELKSGSFGGEKITDRTQDTVADIPESDAAEKSGVRGADGGAPSPRQD
jgi:CRP/FNR family cyclic AMP-dependent transcriptional regulator